MSYQQVVGSLESSPLPGLLTQLGIAIANAQRALDLNAVNMALQLGDRENHGVDVGEEEKKSLLELGFAPVFYHFSEATIDLKLSLSTSLTTEASIGTSVTVGGMYYFVMAAATVSASFSTKYSFSADASSAVTARIASIPPPNAFQNWLASRNLPAQPTDDNPDN